MYVFAIGLIQQGIIIAGFRGIFQLEFLQSPDTPYLAGRMSAFAILRCIYNVRGVGNWARYGFGDLRSKNLVIGAEGTKERSEQGSCQQRSLQFRVEIPIA